MANGMGSANCSDGEHRQRHAGSGRLRRRPRQSELLHLPRAFRWRAGRFSGRLHAAVRRGPPGLLRGRRRTRLHNDRTQLGRQRQPGPEPGPDLHIRHGQRLARSGQPDPLRTEPAGADGNHLQRRPVIRGQRHDQRRRRRRVAERAVPTRGRRSGVVGDRAVRRAGLQLRLERLQRHPSQECRHLGSRQRRGVRRRRCARGRQRVEPGRRRPHRGLLRQLRHHDEQQAVRSVRLHRRVRGARRRQQRFPRPDARPAERAERDHRVRLRNPRP